MKTDFTDALDQALNHLQTGEASSKILAANPDLVENLAPLLETGASLQALRAVEMPSGQALAADRRDFLDEISAFASPPVPISFVARLKGWMDHFFPKQIPTPNVAPKEQRQMSALLIKTVLVFGMIFGSAGGAAAMAAESLPNSRLYPLKLAMENAHLSMADTPAKQAELHLELTQIRAQEMAELAQQGNTPDASTMTRLQHHLEQAFIQAAQTPEPVMAGLLLQAQTILETQAQNLGKFQEHINEPTHTALQKASQLLHQAGQEAAEGIEAPKVFRAHHSGSHPSGGQHYPQPGYGSAITGTGTITGTGVYSHLHQNRHNWQHNITGTQTISGTNKQHQNQHHSRQTISDTLILTGTGTITSAGIYSYQHQNQYHWQHNITNTQSLTHTGAMSGTHDSGNCNNGNCNGNMQSGGGGEHHASPPEAPSEPPAMGSGNNHNNDCQDCQAPDNTGSHPDNHHDDHHDNGGNKKHR
ncbi:MAG TPA: hypothetical protein G4N96_01585 [Chloroflexi bacterium]|nr:hypothetical protein [Chloroflexota bacterium]